MSKPLVIFSHGKESGPQGSKIQALMAIAQRHGAQVMSVDYREHPKGTFHNQNAPDEADRRVAQLVNTPRPEHLKLILVGSSMGGYVSTVASHQLEVDGLFLMAPAFYLPGYSQQEPLARAKTTLLVHGWNDEVVPVRNSIKFAQKNLCELHLLNADHRLNGVLPQIERLFEMFLQQAWTGAGLCGTDSNPARQLESNEIIAHNR